MNLGQLRTLASVELGADFTSAGENQTALDLWANEAVLELLKRVDLRVITATLDTTAGVSDYELSPLVLRVKNVLGPGSDGTYRPLERYSTAEIHELRRGASSISDPSVSGYAMQGMNLVLLYPTPSAVFQLAIDYVRRPNRLTAATDDPSSSLYGGVPEEFHGALTAWVFYRGASAGDDQSSQGGEKYLQAFMLEIQSMRRIVNRHGGRLGPAHVRRRRHRRWWANDRA